MGARGPVPQPTALKVLRGNPGKRALNRREPKPAPVPPKCPGWLDKVARQEWRRVVPVLDRLGLVTQADLQALAGYCQSWARWRQAEAEIAEGGLIVDEDRGKYSIRKANPAVAIAQKERQLMLAFGTRLGLSPSDRGRMTLPELADDDDWGLD